ncbi:TM2 domain-containing protein [Kushneria avicenniae]|uniref:TM2 domain-containing protein n=1 Tax=Kushneria avicenniae TaxID=402385 RepID=A0A1I1JPP1_9GAMM|nr:TM2 domain-containing protein [Kushneria avicenniae]SFC50456.1 TM2 domain-containing protein [Kushneria avicenniae]
MESNNLQGKRKNRIFALILSMFFGIFGIDRFYLGKWKSGILKALTLGGLLLWWFIDAAILLFDAFFCSLGREKGMMKDAKGRDLKYGLSMYRLKNGRFEKDWFK